MTKIIINLFLKNKDPKSAGSREIFGRVAGIVGIVCNVFLCILKFIVGTISNSVSITADATNNLTDAGSSIITLIGFRLSEKPADEDHPYGHARYEYITALVISFLIIYIGFETLRNSFDKILHPEATVFNWVTIAILLASIGVKLWLSRFNKKLGKLINSTALEATAADSRNDCISTAAVLIAMVVSKFIGFNLDGYPVQVL